MSQKFGISAIPAVPFDFLQWNYGTAVFGLLSRVVLILPNPLVELSKPVLRAFWLVIAVFITAGTSDTSRDFQIQNLNDPACAS